MRQRAILGVALLLALGCFVGCHKIPTAEGGEPKEKSSLSRMNPEQGCLALFQRVKACISSIAAYEANGKNLSGSARDEWIASYIHSETEALEKADVFCKTNLDTYHELLPEVGTCFPMTSCESFAECFVHGEKNLLEKKTTDATQTMNKIYENAKKFYETDDIDVTQPQELFPLLKVGMTWPLIVKGENIWRSDTGMQKQRFDFTMVADVKEMKGDIPVKMAYNKVTGPQVVLESIANVEKEIDRMENIDGTIIGDVTKDFLLVNAKDVGNLSNDILTIFPPGPIVGFIPPDHKVRIGETWDSGEVVPMGPMNFDKKKFTFTHAKGQFTLEKIVGIEAHILWSGTADALLKNGSTGTAKWERTIVFDLKNRSIASNTGWLEIALTTGEKITFNVSIERSDK